MNDSDGEPLVAPKAKAQIKAKVTAIQTEKACQSRAREKQKEEDQDNAPLAQPKNNFATLIEEALPKPKTQRAKVTAHAKGDDAKNILRVSKKAAARPTRRAERSIIADPPVSQRRKADIVSNDAHFPRQARPRVK